jgi:hypothetical protein
MMKGSFWRRGWKVYIRPGFGCLVGRLTTGLRVTFLYLSGLENKRGEKNRSTRLSFLLSFLAATNRRHTISVPDVLDGPVLFKKNPTLPLLFSKDGISTPRTCYLFCGPGCRDRVSHFSIYLDRKPLFCITDGYLKNLPRTGIYSHSHAPLSTNP